VRPASSNAAGGKRVGVRGTEAGSLRRAQGSIALTPRCWVEQRRPSTGWADGRRYRSTAGNRSRRTAQLPFGACLPSCSAPVRAQLRKNTERGKRRGPCTVHGRGIRTGLVVAVFLLKKDTELEGAGGRGCRCRPLVRSHGWPHPRGTGKPPPSLPPSILALTTSETTYGVHTPSESPLRCKAEAFPLVSNDVGC
jgi:hypothetical protein